MMRKVTAWVMMIVTTFNITACSTSKKIRYEAEFLMLFNTVTKIVAYTDSKEEFEKHSKFIYDELKSYHELYDIYNDYEGINNIKTINDNAGICPVKVDKKIIDLLSFAKDQYGKTEGKINVAFGAVLKIWHDYREEGINDFENAQIPPMDILKEAAKHTDIQKVIINEKDSTVYLEDPKMRLDVGAIAKGYAVEQVSRQAIKNGFDSGIISVGGNVRTIGYKGKGKELWNIGIHNPSGDKEKPNLEIAYLRDLSLVTSGDYERYYTVAGKNYHHIIDPETLFPAEYFTAITIVCKDSGVADALSTAVFNMPFDEGIAYINGLPNTEALWVFKNGEIKYSDNFKALLKK